MILFLLLQEINDMNSWERLTSLYSRLLIKIKKWHILQFGNHASHRAAIK